MALKHLQTHFSKNNMTDRVSHHVRYVVLGIGVRDHAPDQTRMRRICLNYLTADVHPYRHTPQSRLYDGAGAVRPVPASAIFPDRGKKYGEFSRFANPIPAGNRLQLTVTTG